MWIRTFAEEEMGSQPFLLDILYSKQGILLEYSGGDLENLDGEIQNCLDNLYSPFVYLWIPDPKVTSDEIAEHFLDTEDLPYPVQLSEATSIDIDVFYDTIISGDKLCLVTLKKIWP